jgi:hypothetical protein
MKFLIIALIVIIVRIVIYYLKENKKGVTVLGREIAAADEKERQKIESGNYKKSPLPNFDYRKWEDEQSLINPIENELDLIITNLCIEFSNSDESKRNEIRTSLSQDNIYTLLEFTKRATIFSIRKEEKYIYHGFTTVSMIESERCDFRDVLVTLSFLNHAIQKMNLNAEKIFEKTIQLSEHNTANLVKGFYERPHKSKNIETMGGFVETDTPYGIGYVNTHYKKYNPQKNLVKILFEMSDYLSRDKYRNGEITTGSDIDTFWFGAQDDKNIERLNAKANGCAFIRFILKEGLSVDTSEQYLYIYLTEFKDLNILNTLVGISNHNNSSNFASLCFAEDSILCMVIERSIRQGVKDYETNESLKRFEIALREIINSHL